MRKKTMPFLFLLAAITGVSAATLPPTGPEVADVAQRQDNAALREFIRQHVPVNTPQADGTTALQWAAHWNDTETVKLLIGAGADVKTVNRYGATPISEAAVLGNATVIELLLKAGADANTLTTYDGETVLMTASRSG